MKTIKKIWNRLFFVMQSALGIKAKDYSHSKVSWQKCPVCGCSLMHHVTIIDGDRFDRYNCTICYFHTGFKEVRSITKKKQNEFGN